ncbi:hypothetical protein D3C87_1873980 [compost metagenome]
MERQLGERFVAAVADITSVVIGVIQRHFPVFRQREFQLSFHAANTRFIDVIVAENRLAVGIQPNVVRVALRLVHVRGAADADSVIHIILEGGNTGLHAL